GHTITINSTCDYLFFLKTDDVNVPYSELFDSITEHLGYTKYIMKKMSNVGEITLEIRKPKSWLKQPPADITIISTSISQIDNTDKPHDSNGNSISKQPTSYNKPN